MPLSNPFCTSERAHPGDRSTRCCTCVYLSLPVSQADDRKRLPCSISCSQVRIALYFSYFFLLPRRYLTRYSAWNSFHTGIDTARILWGWLHKIDTSCGFERLQLVETNKNNVGFLWNSITSRLLARLHFPGWLWSSPARMNSFWLDFNGVLKRRVRRQLLHYLRPLVGPAGRGRRLIAQLTFLFTPLGQSQLEAASPVHTFACGLVTSSLSADPRCSKAAVQLTAAVPAIMNIDGSHHLFLEVCFRLWPVCADCPVNWDAVLIDFSGIAVVRRSMHVCLWPTWTEQAAMEGHDDALNTNRK